MQSPARPSASAPSSAPLLHGVMQNATTRGAAQQGDTLPVAGGWCPPARQDGRGCQRPWGRIGAGSAGGAWAGSRDAPTFARALSQPEIPVREPGRGCSIPHFSSPVKASPLSPDSAKQHFFPSAAVLGAAGISQGCGRRRWIPQMLWGVKSRRRMCLSPGWETWAEGAERTRFIWDLGSRLGFRVPFAFAHLPTCPLPPQPSQTP